MKSLSNPTLLNINSLQSFELTFISEKEYIYNASCDVQGWVICKINDIVLPFYNQNWFYHLKGSHNKDYISDFLFESKMKQHDLQTVFSIIHAIEIPKLELNKFQPNLDYTNICFFRKGNVFDYNLRSN